MAYIVDPTDPIQPSGDKGATQGDDELRALKAYIATLAGLGPTGLGVNVFRKNAIIGGDFDTNPWQRGFTFNGLGLVNQYTADRWQYQDNTITAIVGIVNTADAPVLNTVYKNKTADIFGINCLQLNVSTAQTPLIATDLGVITQRIEGYNFRSLAQVPLTLSFWHKHTKTGIYCVCFRNSIADRSYIAEYTQVVSDVWEFDSIVVPASPIAGTWNYTNGTGLVVGFSIGAGVTFQTAPNVWTAGNFIASPNQVNAYDLLNNKCRFSLIQLERGTVASAFERRTAQEELLLCERYFQKSFVQSLAPTTSAGTGTGEFQFPAIKAGALGNFSNTVPFRVRMRIAPTLVFYNVTNVNAQVRDETAAVDCTGTSFNNKQDSGFGVVCVGNAATAVGNLLGVHWTADAEL